MPDFNPNSYDANLARILQRMDRQDEILGRLDSHMETQSARLQSLEREKWMQRGVVATVSALAAAAGTWLAKK